MHQQAALVTGGATRLGRFFSEALADAGFDIALHVNRSREEAEEVANSIRTKGRECEIFHCDFLSDEPRDLIQAAKSRFPGLNLLLNSASAYEPALIAATELAMLETQFRVNMFTPLLLTRHFAKEVKEGQVINIIDNKVAYHQYPYAAYLLSKKSLAEMTRMAALEFAPRIRINGIAPGVVLPASQRTSAYIEWRIEGIPLKRQGHPDHLVQALHYLLDNPFVAGQILFVDGGESINLEGRHSENYSA
ncbi:SDR family NAD(P)-dependent oxidoreductase [Vreelandella neptunia]|jgi:pteridine reductase|uniref:SDR family NAD(P)-dependent oxidoreductase n=1 Tax=Vreelandella neptunia TaxID=115551 RepID=A0ABZ0YMK3_9GAMM|nr:MULTISPECIES: SDR family NAD(P)-dependent oxidoreductase [Halomonas]MBL1268742.1 SDR family NAD(P)-dependent oxidoreductase [Halomonas sp.]MDN3561301.1 SDR family NAD(P)-dependent oxidoreductase [Halomonas neptunia]TDV97259.1 NAD(P)-dependent dehydrogenase (short-subunit alcohol dehydrogenase family) [Halomonas alkaliantarctica]WQH12536.1 SDR family NAD(P)-dependent oxidoreductase [Halomonas neptunia]